MRWWIVGITEDSQDMLKGDRPVYMSHGVVDARWFIATPLWPRLIFFATCAQNTFDSVMSTGIKAVVKIPERLDRDSGCILDGVPPRARVGRMADQHKASAR